MLNIVNTADIDTLVGDHLLFRQIYTLYGAPPSWTRPPGFISLSKIILEQQVSLNSAHAHFVKLQAYIKNFTPTEILKLSDEEMKLCQISRQKSTYLRELSTAVLEEKLDLEILSEQPLAQVRQQLMSVKGIGSWTTDIYLLFCLQAKDVFPLGDIAIINTVKELTPARTKEEVYKQSEKWRPLRSLSAYFLWHYYLKKRGRLVP